MDNEEIYKWEVLRVPNNELSEGCVSMVTANIECLFEWSDKIVDEVDEFNNPISYKSGWLMTPIPKTYVYNNEKSVKLFNTIKNGK